MADSEELFSRTIYENELKGFQLRVVANLFRDVEYLHIRKYFLTFEGEYAPSKEGISIPMSIQNIYAILDSLIELCAKAETVDSITKHFQDKISDLTKDTN
jgi:hypothetical protein